jgi:hypothetical protein
MQFRRGLEAIFDHRFVRLRRAEAKGSEQGGDERRACQGPPNPSGDRLGSDNSVRIPSGHGCRSPPNILLASVRAFASSQTRARSSAITPSGRATCAIASITERSTRENDSAAIASIRHERSAPRSRSSLRSKPLPRDVPPDRFAGDKEDGQKPVLGSSRVKRNRHKVSTRRILDKELTPRLVEQGAHHLRHIADVESFQARGSRRAHANLRRFHAGIAGR